MNKIYIITQFSLSDTLQNIKAFYNKKDANKFYNKVIALQAKKSSYLRTVKTNTVNFYDLRNCFYFSDDEKLLMKKYDINSSFAIEELEIE